MRFGRGVVALGVAAALLLPVSAPAQGRQANPAPLGIDYDAFHVYVGPGQIPAFEQSWLATFGGTATVPRATDLTPTPTTALASQVFSPVALLAVFDFQSPRPYPFGLEEFGWGVADTDAAMRIAETDGASTLVGAFDDPIGRDGITQFPGGAATQLWHETTLSPNPFPSLAMIPDDRIYVPQDETGTFLKSYLAFTNGRIVSDDRSADGAEIGLPGTTYRRVLLTGLFGNTVVIATDGDLPYPFGKEYSGITVANLAATLAKATANGATTLWGPYSGHGGDSAMVEFPGGFITEIHDGTIR